MATQAEIAQSKAQRTAQDRGADWESYLKTEEKQRLLDLRRRRVLKLSTLDEISEEIARLMNRAIRRMRREKGKT